MVPVASVGTNGSKQPRRVRLEALGYGRGALYVSNPGDKDRQRFIHVFSIDGVQCEQRLQARTITQARAEAGKRATKKDEGELVTPSTSTFADVAEEFLAMQTSLVDSGERSPRTIALYRQRFTSHLSSPLGKKRFQHLTTRDVAALLATMRAGGLSPNTMAGVLMLTGSIFRFGFARGYRADNPVERLHRSERPRAKARTQPRTLTDEQCGLLIRNARDSVRDLIAFLAFTGTRQSEALGVTWGELDLEQGSVSINAQLGRLTPTRVPLKTANSRRRIDLHPTLVTMLKERKKLAFAKGLHRDDRLVFTTAVGKPLGHRNVARDVALAGYEAGLSPEGAEPIGCHDLRLAANAYLFLSRARAHAREVKRRWPHSSAHDLTSI